jgi:tetratricopeptide (TPR) repeat protein
MSITLADSYYLKALDLYPFELDQVTEALNFAISYDNDHAGAHCLLGKLNLYQLGKYREAEDHFEKALASDIENSETYYAYAELLIHIGEFGRAKKLIKYAYKIKGISVWRLKYYEGLIAEIKGDYLKAKKCMKLAYANSYRKNERVFLKDELERVKSKMKPSEKARKKREGK